MRYLSPQTFLLLVAAAALLAGGGLWWLSRFVGRAEPRIRRLASKPRPMASEPMHTPPLNPAPAVVVAPEVAVPEVAVPESAPEAAKILRRNRGFTTGSNPTVGTGSHATVHVSAKRPKPLA